MKSLLLKAFVISLFVLPVMRADDRFLWEGGNDYGNGWKQSVEMGAIYTASYPWVWVHQESKWIWVADRAEKNNSTDFWSWDSAIKAWRWQNLNEYPWLGYVSGLDFSWIWFDAQAASDAYYLNTRDAWMSAEAFEQYCHGFALVTGGTFNMGDALAEGDGDEVPIHAVTLSTFYIGRTEVTLGEMVEAYNWAYSEGLLVIGSIGTNNARGLSRELLDFDATESYQKVQISFDGSQFVVDAGKDDYPAIGITWYGLAAYANFRSEMEGLTPCYDFSDWSCNFSANGFRIPTEAEWEYAARGGNLSRGYRYSGSDDYDQVAWDTSNSVTSENPIQSGKGTHRVGLKQPNELGIYDMSGNVWEWCHDWYSSSTYATGPNIDPTGPATGVERVDRGGGWSFATRYNRVAERSHSLPTRSGATLGCRIVRRSF